MAQQVRVDSESLVERARAMAAELPAVLSGEASSLRDQGIDHPAIGRMIDGVARLSRRVGRM